MRRPLFAFCLIAIACIRIGCGFGFISTLSDRVCEMQSILTENPVVLQGQVYQKDDEFFYIKSIIIQNQNNQNLKTISQDLKLKCYLQEEEAMAQVRLGSIVLLSGDFVAYEAASNPGQFDAFAYYAGQGICGRLTDCKLLQCSQGYSVTAEWLYQLRCKMSRRLYELLPEREASVMNTILLGKRNDMDGELKELYRVSGILHIASISGLHISVIAMLLYRGIRKAGGPILTAAGCSFIIILLYGVMTGMSTSTVRAIGMFGIHMLGDVLGRTYDMLTALGVLALTMVFDRPDYLWDGGFLLSYGAICGIAILYPCLKGEKRTPHKFKRNWEKYLDKCSYRVWDSFAAGLAVILMLLPIQVWFYFETPVYSVFLNLLIVPSMSLLVSTGFGMFLPGGKWLAVIPYGLLRLYEWLCENFLFLPGHTIISGRPEIWQVVVYYFCVGAALLCSGKKLPALSERLKVCVKPKVFQVLKWVVLFAGVYLLLADFSEHGSSITFLDVGQGDCICVRTADGGTYIFDCGSSSEHLPGEYILLPYLKYYGISQVDGLFLSHGDRDHCNGAQELLQNAGQWGITIKQLILPDLRQVSIEEQFGEVLAAASRERIPITYVSAGGSVHLENLYLLCLHPQQNAIYGDSNAMSQCFYLRIGTNEDAMLSVLLTGDVEGQGEEQLTAQLRYYGIENVDVLKVAHHGSMYSTTETFLKQVHPAIAIISCGEDNSYGHPHPETLHRLEQVGSEILATPEWGAIMVEIGQKIEGLHKGETENKIHTFLLQ